MEKQNKQIETISIKKTGKVDFIAHLPVFVKKGIDRNGQEYLTISFPTVFNAFPPKNKAEK